MAADLINFKKQERQTGVNLRITLNVSYNKDYILETEEDF